MLAPAVGGQIAALRVEKGDAVKAGQLLITLWNKDLTAELELARQQAAVAEASARETCLLADYAGRQAERQIELRKNKSTSESSYEEAVSTAAAKKAACRAAEAQKAVSAARIDAASAMVERTTLLRPLTGSSPRSTARSANTSPPRLPGSPPCRRSI